MARGGELQPGQQVLLPLAGGPGHGPRAILQPSARPARHRHRGKVAVTGAHVTCNAETRSHSDAAFKTDACISKSFKNEVVT